jgi:uncharacterized caspase-like protein
MATESEIPGTRGLNFQIDETNWGFKGTNYLFLIGIDKYQHWPPLKSAVKDVQDFADLLTSRYQFEKSNVIMLKDEAATENNIINMFIDLAEKKITSEDNLIVYFSGHGCEKASTGYWIPVDAPKDQPGQFINTAIIADWLKNINSLHTFLIVDACFSGKLVSQLRGSKSEKFKSRRIFTSGRAEVVADGREGENSPFAKGLLLSLSQNTKPLIYATRLIAEVKEYVEREAKQKPMDASIINADDEGGEFIFHLKLSEPEIWMNVVQQHKKETYKKFIEDFPSSPHKAEALDAYDWFNAFEKGSVEALTNYLADHAEGTYVAQAIEALDDASWKRATTKNTVVSFIEYLRQFPKGRYAQEAKESIKKFRQDDDDTRIEREVAEERAIRPSDVPAEKPRDEDAWNKAKTINTYIAYRDFILAFPNSKYAEEAKKKGEYHDSVAFNQIKIMAPSNLPCKQKIEKCINYFNEFPGAPNNAAVKQIKDKLEIARIKTGTC